MTAAARARVLGELRRQAGRRDGRALLRRRLVERCRGRLRGHRGVEIGRRVKLGGPGEYALARGVRIKPDARVFVAERATFEVAAGARVGERAVINVVGRVAIGAGSEVSWDCQISDTDFHRIERADGTVRPMSADVRIGRHVLIGSRALIGKGVTIGDGAIVAAGSVVVRDVPAGTMVAGNPAREVGAVRDWR